MMQRVRVNSLFGNERGNEGACVCVRAQGVRTTSWTTVAIHTLAPPPPLLSFLVIEERCANNLQPQDQPFYVVFLKKSVCVRACICVCSVVYKVWAQESLFFGGGGCVRGRRVGGCGLSYFVFTCAKEYQRRRENSGNRRGMRDEEGRG